MKSVPSGVAVIVCIVRPIGAKDVGMSLVKENAETRLKQLVDILNKPSSSL